MNKLLSKFALQSEKVDYGSLDSQQLLHSDNEGQLQNHHVNQTNDEKP